MNGIRINRYLAGAGICSRRKAEELILQGRVSVNGRDVLSLSVRIDPSKDRVLLDGKPVREAGDKIYLALNKPRGVICSAADGFGRRTVMDLVKDIKTRLHYAGRLDYDTSGLVILTNDGEMSQKIAHPRNMVDKRYIAKIKGVPDREALERFQAGLQIDGYRTAPASMRIIKKRGSSCTAEIVIHEGHKRQVRRMCADIGHPAAELKRVAVGKIKLGGLKEGAYRHLRKKELEYLGNL